MICISIYYKTIEGLGGGAGLSFVAHLTLRKMLLV